MLYISRMKKTTFVALLLLSSPSFAKNLNETLQNIESEWATIYYNTPKQKQESAYYRLLDKTINLSKQHPKNAEPIICLLYTSPSPRDRTRSRMPSSA